MFFTPRPVPKRVSGGVVCLMLVILGVALLAGFDLMGGAEFPASDPGGGVVRATHSVESSAPPVVARIAAETAAGTDKAPIRPDAFVTVGQSAIQALTAVITRVIKRVVTEWWPTALVLDWMQAVHRAWPSIHRLPGTGPSQP